MAGVAKKMPDPLEDGPTATFGISSGTNKVLSFIPETAGIGRTEEGPKGWKAGMAATFTADMLVVCTTNVARRIRPRFRLSLHTTEKVQPNNQP